MASLHCAETTATIASYSVDRFDRGASTIRVPGIKIVEAYRVARLIHPNGQCPSDGLSRNERRDGMRLGLGSFMADRPNVWRGGLSNLRSSMKNILRAPDSALPKTVTRTCYVIATKPPCGFQCRLTGWWIGLISCRWARWGSSGFQGTVRITVGTTKVISRFMEPFFTNATP